MKSKRNGSRWGGETTGLSCRRGAMSGFTRKTVKEEGAEERHTEKQCAPQPVPQLPGGLIEEPQIERERGPDDRQVDEAQQDHQAAHHEETGPVRERGPSRRQRTRKRRDDGVRVEGLR
jgi:hypothetical protein